MEMQDSFLLDEVRCGFLVPAVVKQAWAAELEVLAEIDRVCRKYNIQYFADWGTLLGAVRHGGFIPWDDDLDIVMKREDYIKFMTIARYDMEEGFDVQTFRNHDDCWLFMGKVVGKNNFCFEKEHLRRFHNFPYIASVDIFVLDYVYREPEKEERRRRLCKFMLGVADKIAEGYLAFEEKERNLRYVEEMYGKQLKRIEDVVEMRRHLYGEVEKIFAEVPEQEADYLTQMIPWGLKGSSFLIPKQNYEKFLYMDFECTVMPVPQMYDEILKLEYGDYKKLVKAGGDHNYPFFEGQKQNLQKVLDFQLPEFRVDKDKIHRIERKKSDIACSYKEMAKECVCELENIKEQIGEIIKKVPLEQCQIQGIEWLQIAQQLAVDLGNLLEQFPGEGSAMIPLLEQYCEDVYSLYEQFTTKAVEQEISLAYSALQERQKAITNEVEQKVLKRKCVLFLPVMAKDWKHLQALWETMVQENLCDVFVMPLPYFYKDYDGSSRKICYEASEFPDNLHLLEYQDITPEYMELWHPEIIVIQNPYDGWNSVISVPERFYAEQLRNCTEELIYVSPFELEEYTKQNEREYGNMKYYVTMPGVVYADKILVQSEEMRRVYIEKLTEFVGMETKEVWEQRLMLK